MKISAFICAITAVVLFTGCEVVHLANGKYETGMSGRGDFAAVYGDMIIIRLRNPHDETGTENGYWDWGGKYEIEDDNSLVLKMDRETARNWNFYYGIRRDGNAISVTDYRAEKTFQLKHVPALPKRRTDSDTPIPPAAYPAYN